LLLVAAERSWRHQSFAHLRSRLVTRNELIGRYAELTGRDLSLINYYEVFALFKLAVVLQQIYVRFSSRADSGRAIPAFDKRVHNLIQQAVALI